MIFQKPSKFWCSFTCVLLLSIAGPLLSASPSSLQINQLIEVARIQKQSESIQINIETMALQKNNEAKVSIQRLNLPVQQRQQLDEIIDEVIPLIRQEASWEQMEPLYRQSYARHLNSDDIQVLLDFYHTPAQQAYLNIVQQVMQNQELHGNPTTIAQTVKQRLLTELSSVELNTLHEFQSSVIGQRVQQKFRQADLEVIQTMQQRIGLILEHQIEKLELLKQQYK